MKILQINCVYKKGSTGRLTAEIHHSLQAKGIDSVVCYGRGNRVTEDCVYKTCREWYSRFCHLLTRFDGVMYGKCFFSTNNLLRIIKREKPDIVHLQCINGYFVNIYRLISWLKKHEQKTVLTLHAEFMYTANCGHALECEKWKNGCHRCERFQQETESVFFDGTSKSWKKMKKAFTDLKKITIVSVSEWLYKRAEQADILRGISQKVIYNGIDTAVFKRIEDVGSLRRKHNIDESTKVILHVTASFTNPFKGGKFVLKLAEMMKDENVCFVIIGNNDSQVEYADNVIDVGRVESTEQLATYYSMADVSIITSKKETFSMPVAESLCCGTPVVGFEAGAPEQIAIQEYSRFVNYGDIEGLRDAVMQMLNVQFERFVMAEKAKERYGNQKMLDEYEKLYYEILRKES